MFNVTVRSELTDDTRRNLESRGWRADSVPRHSAYEGDPFTERPAFLIRDVRAADEAEARQWVAGALGGGDDILSVTRVD